MSNIKNITINLIKAAIGVIWLTAASVAIAGNTLTSNQWLNINQSLVSNNGEYRLTMQGDGNLVLYKVANSQALWSTNTHNRPGARAVMQSDGNFVLYRNGSALWSTGTHGNPGAYLIMQDDGNLVVYSSSGAARWDSGTNQPVCQWVDVPVWGGKYEEGRFYRDFFSTCWIYVPPQTHPGLYRSWEYDYRNYRWDWCEIYPTYSGIRRIRVCN